MERERVPWASLNGSEIERLARQRLSRFSPSPGSRDQATTSDGSRTTYGRPPTLMMQRVGVAGERAYARWLTDLGIEVTYTSDPLYPPDWDPLMDGNPTWDPTVGDLTWKPKRPSGAVGAPTWLEVKSARPQGWARYGTSLNSDQMQRTRAHAVAWAVMDTEDWPPTGVTLMGWLPIDDIRRRLAMPPPERPCRTHLRPVDELPGWWG